MTSDAKIGLLLGLVFIFIIAFIINGLPNFHKSSASGDINGNELTTNMVSLQNGPPALAAREHKAQEILNTPQQAQPTSVPPAENTVSPTETPAQIKTGQVIEVGPTAQAQPSPQGQQEQVVAAAEQQMPAQKEESIVKTYTVREGDTLATIAKKCYGAETGNKKATIDALYNANRKSLKSPDDLDVGQKLTIPALSTSGKNQADNLTNSKMFKNVDSVGQRHLETASNNNSSTKSKQGGQYTVREGDTLWKIAADQLGDGTRYKEIVRLNNTLLDSEDDLTVGMTLKMPSR